MIPKHIEQRIKDSASIVDVVTKTLGVQLHRRGVQLVGFCPFHDDHSVGSFTVSEAKNICSCFSCGNKNLDPVGALIVGKNMSYNEALRHLASMYGIKVDNEPVPQVEQAKPREKAPELPIRYFDPTIVGSYMRGHQDNTLLRYLRNLPLTDGDRERLENAIALYLIGTSTKGKTAGRIIFWQLDQDYNVRTGKLMDYLPNGHRNKEVHPSWIHTLMEKAGKFDSTKEQVDKCLFGLHLMKVYPDAEVRIVESEKTALICSAFTNMEQVIWMATGGMSNLSMKQLQPLIDAGRTIILYPDYDGYAEWERAASVIGYKNLIVSETVRKQWKSSDGAKADIADIMMRLLYGHDSEVVEELTERIPSVGELITGLGLTVDKIEPINLYENG